MTWETEEMSDVQSQSQMTTDTYGYGEGPDQKIIWSDDPEQAYFRAMLQDQDDQSLIGDSTIHDLLEGRQRCMSQDDDSMLQGPRHPGTSGLSYYDTDAEDDTIAKIETDAEDQGWFAARRSTMEGPPTRQSLQTPLPASSQGASAAYKYNSPISVLSSRDRAGEGQGVKQPFAVPNPNLVPRTPNTPRGPAVGGQVVTNPEGDGHQRKIIPGYIFVTEGHSSVVETKKSSPTNKSPRNDKTPQAKAKSRFSVGRPTESTKPPGQIVPTSQMSPTKGKREDLTVDTGDASERRRKRKLCLCKLMIVFLMVALIVGIAMLALVFRSRNTNESSQSNILPPGDSAPTLPPNSNPISVPTSPPKVGGTTSAPTSNPKGNGEPTLAPITSTENSTTVDTVKEFLVSVSPISAPSLDDATSPQSRALEWLIQGLTNTTSTRLRTRHLQELDSNLIQRWALAVIFYSTGGDGDIDDNATISSWTSDSGWLDFTHECEWSFILCDDSNALKELTIEDNGLMGDIPPEIGLLGEKLLKLSFNNNSLVGTLPTTLGQLTGLTHISFQYNMLTGPLPTELGALSLLQSLTLSRNFFDGTIPSQVGNLLKLNYLDLALTNITGTIPTEVGQLMDLELISLVNTHISGTIPLQLGDIPTLKGVKLGRMDLTGEIPPGLCSRTLPLEELRADCDEVACPCCTLCCVDNGGCSQPSPSATGSPTRIPTSAVAPTQLTTSSPTATPPAPTTSSPTATPPAPTTSSPTATPPVPTTSSPTATPPAPTTPSPTATAQVPATPSPTVKSTPSPTATATADSCQSSISSDRTCYLNGDDVVVAFSNCDPLGDDWIGVYATGQDFTSLQEPIAWVWTTGDQSQQAAVNSGSITFFDVQGTGTFQLVLAHNGSGPPFSAKAVSVEFQLAQQC